MDLPALTNGEDYPHAGHLGALRSLENTAE